MINLYSIKRANKLMPTGLWGPYSISLWATCLLLSLLLGACGRATTDAQALLNNEETAIEDFIDSAPVAAQNESLLRPNSVPPMSASRIPLPEIDPFQVLGDITIAGNSTLLELSERLYVRFVADGYAGFIKLEELSSSEGFQAFCRGATDSVAATRPMLQEELDSCLQLGRTPVAFPVAKDALVIVVNRANDFVQDVTLTELAAIFKAKRWSDVNPAWPKRKILRFLPQSTTDSFLFFADVAFQGNSRLVETAPNSSFLPDAIEIIQHIQDNVDAIGLLNYTSYRERSDDIQIIKLAGLQPELTTMQAGTYPLQRTLLFYSSPEVLQSKKQLAGFLTFYLTYVNEEVNLAGQFPLTRAELDRSRLNLLVGTANEAFLDDLRETLGQ